MTELSALLDNARHAIIVRDLEGRVVFWNKGAERIYGWPAAEAVGKSAEELSARKDLLSQYEQAQRDVIEKGEWTGELRETTRQGEEIVVESYWTLARDDEGRPASIYIVCTDITSKKEIEDRLLHVQRLESIGMLASEIAHDISNVLSPILLAIEALRVQLEDEESQYLLAKLRINTERGAGLIDRLLAYVSGRDSSPARIRPEYLIADIAWVLNRLLPKSVHLSLSLEDGLWPVTGDFTQLYQVLLNLCLNARDAMPEGGGITIKAENTYRDDENGRPARYVVISVVDSGRGIPNDIMGKIFDPFFTTKEPGKGTGLGLATVARIVEMHGGFIDLKSEGGSGTEFRVYLPAGRSDEAKVLNENREDRLSRN